MNVIQCALNSKEKKIGNFSLDGFVVHNGKRIGMDYEGCRWHPCTNPNCRTVFNGDEEAVRRQKERAEFLQTQLDEYIVMRECEFQPNENDPALLSFAFNRTIDENMVLEAVKQDKLFGIVRCDISTPADQQAKVQ